jgi:hypothetical protein
MNISREDAEATLAEVESVQKQTIHLLAASYASPILMLWGSIWIVAFLGSHFWVQQAGYIWIALSMAGGIATFFICWRQFKKTGPTKSRDASTLGRRIFWFWILLLGFIVLWLKILPAQNGMQMNVFICTASMFAYVVMGLWLESRFLMWLGLAVTGIALLGYYPLREYYNLWMAVTGGGAIFGTGLYIRLRWR